MLPVQRRGKRKTWGKSHWREDVIINDGCITQKKTLKMFKFFLLLAVLAVAHAGNVKVCLGCIGVKSAREIACKRQLQVATATD